MTGHPRARRGFVLLFTLLASMVAAVLGVSALAYVRLERADAQAFARTTSHEHALSTGVEEALALLHAFPGPRRVICERNGGDPNDPTSCDYRLNGPNGAYRIDFTSYAYPGHPHFTGVAPATDPTTRVDVSVDPADIRIATWAIRHP